VSTTRRRPVFGPRADEVSDEFHLERFGTMRGSDEKTNKQNVSGQVCTYSAPRLVFGKRVETVNN